MVATSAKDQFRNHDPTSRKLSYDHVVRSRHKTRGDAPTVVDVEHDGRTIQLVLPAGLPACDFLVTAATEDWLFLIGRQRVQGKEIGADTGVIIAARRHDKDLYVTELWHETYGSFLARAGLGLSPEIPAQSSPGSSDSLTEQPVMSPVTLSVAVGELGQSRV